jgi:SAM-dependent methyltransferase
MKTEPSKMLLAHWQHEIIDLVNAQDFVENPDMSVLANAVEYLNLCLIRRLPAEAHLLEIGCGVHSLIKDSMAPPRVWEGIDVIDRDRRGTPTIATRIASVQAVPWNAGSFDYVLSNQSIEHWHEYGVDISEGLAEICRVLKPNGIAVINFPIHLHGHRLFVEGRFDAIDHIFTESGFSIERRVAVINSSCSPYQGWRLCGFPDFLVRRYPGYEKTSYVVEYEVRNTAAGHKAPAPNSVRANRRINIITRLMHYGIRYAIWKLLAQASGRDRKMLNNK